MASYCVYSGAILGLDAFPIEVEVDSTPGLHFFNIVGLPDKTVEESKDRIGSAIRNSGLVAPNQKNRRVIVNLAPADIKKEGPAFDLPIALGYLLTTQQISFDTSKKSFLGELSLDGSLRRINGVLPLTFMAKERGFEEIIIPQENVPEAAVVEGIKVIGVRTLGQLVNYLQDKTHISPAPVSKYEDLPLPENHDTAMDMSHIQGQENAKRALAIAASGGHNILLQGPPGSGKTILAKALATILPRMTYQEALEVTKIYSISGLMGKESLLTQRPFRNPHHTTSAVAVVGGGSWPKPGEISLAHRGVLFLDEMPEFPRNVIEALRQPMEGGEVVVSRAAGSVKFPARFMLVGAMNPCPCGNFGDDKKACICNPLSVRRYQKKLSGPVLDRIDIQITVPQETYDKLRSTGPALSSTVLREQVISARNVQQERFKGTKLQTNSEMGIPEIKLYCTLTEDAEKLIRSIVMSHNLSGRSYHKILKIARTIADLEKRPLIEGRHVAEAASYRTKTEEQSWS